MNQASLHISDVDLSIIRNNHKLTADKIIQILDSVREEASKSRRRWIWELMQNAKDVENDFKKVDILIKLCDGEFRFAHNGNPFTIDNITGLIQQVSSKPSNSSDVNTTGKFGTGFITTHLLSDIIRVNGVVERPGNRYRRFSIELDRSGKTSEELLPGIERALDEIRLIDTSDKFPEIENYKQLRKEDNLDSEFIYSLTDNPAKEAAKVGLNDLIFTMPITMINIEKIGVVRIIDEINNTTVQYHSERIEKGDTLNRYEVKVYTNGSLSSTKRYFVWLKDDVKLICEVNNWKELSLIDNFKKQPFLYRDFPLVGTENFHFPFILNGLSFFPTEKRNGILINGNTEKPNHNRKLIQKAIAAAIEFTDALVSKGCKNLYVLANTQIPNVEMEDDTRKWYLQNQKDWRTQLLTKKLIESGNGSQTLSDCFVPEFDETQSGNNMFWDLVSGFLGTNNIPITELNSKWAAVVKAGAAEEYEAWGKQLILTRPALLRQVEQKQSIERLDAELPCKDGLAWLNKVYNFLSDNNQLDLLNSFQIVPNQYGKLNFLKTLFKETPDSKIPDAVLDVLKELGQDWRNEMIHRKVEIANLQHVERGLGKASEEINIHLKKEARINGITTDFLNHPKSKHILISILRLTTKESRATSFRSRLYEYCSSICHLTEGLFEVESLDGFNFEISNRLVIRMINGLISSAKNITALSTLLNKDKDSTVVWLDSYLRFLSASQEYKHLIEYGNIIPNRYNLFCAYNDLYNYGTKEQKLDAELVVILKELNGKEDWNQLLIADGIGISVKNTKTFDELGTVITSIVAVIRQQDNYDNYQKPLLSLIEWCQKNSRLAKHYLTDFDNRKNSIFFTLTMEKSTLGSQMMGLLKNQDRLKLLIDISNSAVSIKDLQEIVNITSRIGRVEEILGFARSLEEEEIDFNFKLQIGKNIEDAFLEALTAEGLNAEVKYQGIGSHDFKISNPQNGKLFYIEIKSFSPANLISPIRMSISQVQLAVSQGKNFSLCVIERPHHYIDANIQHIKQNLTLVRNYESKFTTALSDYQNFAQIAQKSGDISLEFFDTECKIRISHSFINNNHQDFGALIAQIRTQLMLPQ